MGREGSGSSRGLLVGRESSIPKPLPPRGEGQGLLGLTHEFGRGHHPLNLRVQGLYQSPHLLGHAFPTNRECSRLSFLGMLSPPKAQNPSISQAFGSPIPGLRCQQSPPPTPHPSFLLVNEREGLERAGLGTCQGSPLRAPEGGLSVASSISVNWTLKRGTDGISGMP